MLFLSSLKRPLSDAVFFVSLSQRRKWTNFHQTPELEEIHTRARRIAGHFKSSTKAKEKLLEMQVDIGRKLKMIQEVEQCFCHAGQTTMSENHLVQLSPL